MTRYQSRRASRRLKSARDFLIRNAMITVSAETIGIIAGVLTTGSFLPQVFQIIRDRNTASISLGMYGAFTSGVLLWLVYGVMIWSPSIMVTNALTLILSGIVLIMKLRLG